MNNIFYTSKSNFNGESSVEIKGQEALHISKVLRHKVGDSIWVADGEGARFEAEITEITRRGVSCTLSNRIFQPEPEKKKILGMGVIKKRDRLEFAIEKAVELDVWEICLFNADHSERSKLNADRLNTQIISAFKQSGRYWLPNLVILESLDEVFDSYQEAVFIMAHEETEVSKGPKPLTENQTVLLVGPEGGFSSKEIAQNKERKGEFISLGKNRLRAETAVASILSHYIFQ